MKYIVIHECGRCGAEFEGKARTAGMAELNAERAYDAHECRNPDGTPMPSLKSLSLDELRRLAYAESGAPIPTTRPTNRHTAMTRAIRAVEAFLGHYSTCAPAADKAALLDPARGAEVDAIITRWQTAYELPYFYCSAIARAAKVQS